jgi:hypothetical protein
LPIRRFSVSRACCARRQSCDFAQRSKKRVAGDFAFKLVHDSSHYFPSAIAQPISVMRIAQPVAAGIRELLSVTTLLKRNSTFPIFQAACGRDFVRQNDGIIFGWAGMGRNSRCENASGFH